MNSLQQHVERLFRGYPNTTRTRELKEEILGNLEAKAADLAAQGWSEEEARQRAAASLTTLDGLMDDGMSIALKPYLSELLQWTMIYLVIAWILSIPARAVGTGLMVQLTLIGALLLTGVGYALVRLFMRGETQTSYTHIKTGRLTKAVRILWVLWALFLAIHWLDTTILRFGSNVWYGRPVEITGPYQWAVTAYSYALPVLSLVLPLAASRALRLLHRHERRDTV